VSEGRTEPEFQFEAFSLTPALSRWEREKPHPALAEIGRARFSRGAD